MNYNNRKFKVQDEDSSKEVTTFEYYQKGNVVWGCYSGGGVTKGTLIAKVDAKGVLDMHYHHLNEALEFKKGICKSIPQLLDDGRIQLFETYESVGTDPITKGEITLIEIL